MALFSDFVQVPLDDIPSICCVTYAAQLCAICRLAEGILDLTAIVRDIEEQKMWKLLKKVDCHELFAHTLSVKRKKKHSTFIFQNPLLCHTEN